MFIDTHTHLFSEQFNEDRDKVVQRAIDSGISTLLLPNIDVASIQPMFELHSRFPENCLPMVGLHPGSVGADVEEELSAIKKVLYAHREQCVAVGEIGMDLYWDKTFIKEQEHAFREQIRWAKELQLPIAIHARDAFDEIFSVLDEVNDNQLTGVFHCFTGTHEHAQHILSYGGFKLGIGGVVTYKTSKLPEVLTHIDLKHIILETDSPYLPPVPYRGKRNESAYLLHIAEKLTEIYGMPLKEIADATTLNAKELFSL